MDRIPRLFQSAQNSLTGKCTPIFPVDVGTKILADPGCAAQGSRFFRFDLQFLQNVAVSGVGGAATRSTPPLPEILDLPLQETGVLIWERLQLYK